MEKLFLMLFFCEEARSVTLKKEEHVMTKNIFPRPSSIAPIALTLSFRHIIHTPSRYRVTAAAATTTASPPSMPDLAVLLFWLRGGADAMGFRIIAAAANR